MGVRKQSLRIRGEESSRQRESKLRIADWELTLLPEVTARTGVGEH